MANYLSYSATQMAYQALRKLGELRPGQSASADMLADILTELQVMIDAWQLERRRIPAIRPDAYTLTAGVQFYLIGPGAAPATINGVTYGGFNAARPNFIEDANVVLNTAAPVVRRPLALLNADQWADIRVQAIPSAIPLRLWYDRNFSSSGGESGGTTFTGFGVIALWPGPLAAYQLELFCEQNLQQFFGFADLTTAWSFPPGYADAMVLSLAEKIAPMAQVYLKTGNPLTAEVKRQAAEARERIDSYNAPSRLMHADPAVMGNARGGWNYATGEYNGAR